MKKSLRELSVAFAPCLACCLVISLAQGGLFSAGAGGGKTVATETNSEMSIDKTTLLVPKDVGFLKSRRAMLETQRERYLSALKAKSTLFESGDSSDAQRLQRTMLSASREYDFLAMQTADAAFQNGNLPRTLPKP